MKWFKKKGDIQKRQWKLGLLDIKRFHRLLDNSVTKACCGTKIKQVYWFYLEWINSQNTSWLFRHGQAVQAPSSSCHSTFQYDGWTDGSDRRPWSSYFWDREKGRPKSHHIHLTTFLTTHAPLLTALVPWLCNLHVWLFLSRDSSQIKQNWQCIAIDELYLLYCCDICGRWTGEMRKNDGHFVSGVCYENSSWDLQKKCKCSLGSGS